MLQFSWVDRFNFLILIDWKSFRILKINFDRGFRQFFWTSKLKRTSRNAQFKNLLSHFVSDSNCRRRISYCKKILTRSTSFLWECEHTITKKRKREPWIHLNMILSQWFQVGCFLKGLYQCRGGRISLKNSFLSPLKVLRDLKKPF